MINLIGSEGYSGKAVYQGITDLVGQPGVHVHIYGKEQTKHNRKMGHVTIAASSMEKAKQIADDIKEKIVVIA